MKSPPLLLTALATCALALPLVGQTLTNGTGGGVYSDPATWQGSVPTGNVQIVSGDTLFFQSGDVYNNASGNFNFQLGAEMVIENGADVFMRRILATASGTGVRRITINGGSLNASRLGWGADPAEMIINGGIYTDRDNVAWNGNTVTTINGGTLQPSATAGTLVIQGGVVDFMGRNNPFISNFTTWTGGTMTNVWLINSNTMRGAINEAMTAGSIFDITDQSALVGAQQLNYGSVPLQMTAGTIQFDVYSNAANDSDSIITTSGASSLPSGLGFLIGDGGGLTGTPDDFIGVSYQLLDLGNYANIAPSILSTTWDIGGDPYAVTFTSQLNVDGTVTVDGLTLIPEPGTMAMIAGLLAGFLVWRRRQS